MHGPRCGWVAGRACSSTRPPAGSSPGSAGSAGPSAGQTYGAAAASPGSSSPPRGSRLNKTQETINVMRSAGL